MDLATINARLTTLENDLATCLATTEPSVPTSCVATFNAAKTIATITFGTPVSNGGSAITGYTVTATPGSQSVSGASSPLVVTGLTGAILLYTFEVRAQNAVGHSVPCVSAAVGAPTSTYALNQNANFVNGHRSSPDGFSWGNSNTTAGSWRAAYNGSGTWLGTNQTGPGLLVRSVTNPFGVEFSASGITQPFAANGSEDICYAGNLSRWVCTGNVSPFAYYSNDNGSTWTACSGLDSVMQAIAYDGVGRFVSVRPAGGGLRYSNDGISWLPCTVTGIFTMIAYGMGRWVVANTGPIYSSPDGITFTLVFTPVGTLSNSGLACNGIDKFMIVEGGSSAVTSPDGLTWTEVTILGGTVAQANTKLAVIGTQWVNTGSTQAKISLDNGVTFPFTTGTISLVGDRISPRRLLPFA